MPHKSGHARLFHWWPHHVALPVEALRGAENSTAMYGLAKTLAGALPPYYTQRNGRDMVVFCFATAEAAQTFHERFGGEVLEIEKGRW